MSAKTYKKLFIRSALKLFIASVSFRFINFTAGVLFSRAKKPGKLLRFTNGLLNRKICECSVLHENCEYFKGKLDEYAPV